MDNYPVILTKVAILVGFVVAGYCFVKTGRMGEDIISRLFLGAIMGLGGAAGANLACHGIYYLISA